jgi:hypothetical protein
MGGQPGGIGVEGVADVDYDFAGQLVPVLADDRRGAGVRQSEDDDISGRGGADFSCRGAAAERAGQIGGLDRVAADDLDGVAAFDRAGAQDAGHLSHADDADAAHGVLLASCAGQALRPSLLASPTAGAEPPFPSENR